MPSLSKNQSFDGFTVSRPLEQSNGRRETYRVKDNDGTKYFLKLFDPNVGNDDVELALARKGGASSPCVANARKTGVVSSLGSRAAYIAYDFIVGESLRSHMDRERFESKDDVFPLVCNILDGLTALQRLDVPLLHTSLTPDNVMLDKSQYLVNACVIGLSGLQTASSQGARRQARGLSAAYCPTESFLTGNTDIRSCIFSVGVILYEMLLGTLPFDCRFLNSSSDPESNLDKLMAARHRGILLPEYMAIPIDLQTQAIIEKALAEDPSQRFLSPQEFKDALQGKVHLAKPKAKKKKVSQKIKKGNGFADVAGMDELKEMLTSDVINLLQQPQKAKELGLTIPNGILFYGPPGCGKTFFAEKFAEELGCTYKYVSCSDVASPYIHGGQDKIAALFDEARKNAPTLLFLDEVDAMLKNRSKQDNASMSGEVNEFLTQINNCGQDRVLVVGATNRPLELDEAVLRAGRLELKFYIPQPDYDTRVKLFEINLRDRGHDSDIDCRRLASLTDNYVSADIKLIVDTAARTVFRQGLDAISMQALEEAIQNVAPSLTPSQIKEHEAIRDKFTGRNNNNNIRRIGF